jgi:hypothetical protein
MRRAEVLRIIYTCGSVNAWETGTEFFTQPMQLVLLPQNGFLLAKAAGRVSIEEVLRVFKYVIDTSTERGFDKILIDFLAVTGRLSDIDRYDIGKAMAEYCRNKSIHPRVAVIGKPPIVTGFGAKVASNRGLISATFSESQSALDWLHS